MFLLSLARSVYKYIGRVFYEPDIDPIFIKLEEQSEALFELKKKVLLKILECLMKHLGVL